MLKPLVFVSHSSPVYTFTSHTLHYIPETNSHLKIRISNQKAALYLRSPPHSPTKVNTCIYNLSIILYKNVLAPTNMLMFGLGFAVYVICSIAPFNVQTFQYFWNVLLVHIKLLEINFGYWLMLNLVKIRKNTFLILVYNFYQYFRTTQYRIV